MSLLSKTPKNPNEQENRPMSYAAWLYEKGKTLSDADGGFRADVIRAEEAYQSSLPTFGKNAESLAQSGLSDSGYASYLAAAAEAGKEKAKSDASLRLSERNRSLGLGYRAYLADYAKSQERLAASLEAQLIRDGVKDSAYAYDYALSKGLGKELALRVAEYGAEVTAERQREAAEKFVIDRDMTEEEAYRYALGLGIPESRAKSIALAAGEYHKSRADKASWLGEMTPAEYLDYLRSLDQTTLNTYEK